MNKILRSIIIALSASLFVASSMTSPAFCQARGGPPGGMPVPAMPNLPSQARGMSGMDGVPGPPDWAGRPDDRGGYGFEHAQQAREAALTRPSSIQRARARKLVDAYPDKFELDVNGSLVVRGEVLAGNLTDRDLARAQRAGFTIVRSTDLKGFPLTLVTLSHPGWPVRKMVKALRRIAPGAAIDANQVYFPSGRAIGIARGLAGVGPAVGETAVRIGMIDAGAIWPTSARMRTSMVRRGFAGAFHASDHGTAVAQILAHTAYSAEPSHRGTTIFAADIFGNTPVGGSASAMLGALGWMAQEQVPVINVSMVGPYNMLVASAVANLHQRGFLIIAPVGNDSASAQPMFPASLADVVAVTAVDRTGQLLPEASRVRKVDFAAPGIAIVEDAAGRAHEVRGTSFASPVVAGRLAPLLTRPDVRLARKALDSLAAESWKPRSGPDRRHVGRGIVGLSPPARN